VIAGCGGEPANPYVGNMDDFSYAGHRGRALGPNASGKEIGVAQFAGNFVWMDYSAPWCPPCTRQAPVIRQLEHVYKDKVVFVTVLTSDAKPGDPSTQYTARRWSKQYALDADHVIAGTQWGRVIPQHALFSPLGQTLYLEVGLKSEMQIRSTINKFTREWTQWYAENKNSMSVLLGEIHN
jgi:thiol-disulfide isomerase/thioredoxin